MHELLMKERRPCLVGHPDLTINSGAEGVLWVGTEEDTPTLRFKADQVLKGLGNPILGGTLLHLWALGNSSNLVKLTDLPKILEIRDSEHSAEWLDEAKAFADQMRGEMVPEDIFDRARRARDEFRSKANSEVAAGDSSP